MARKEFQAWGPPGGPASCFSTVEGIQDLIRKGLMEQDHVHLYSIQATSYLDAMQQYYRMQDWGEYKPMLDKDGNPYPDESKEFDS